MVNIKVIRNTISIAFELRQAVVGQEGLDALMAATATDQVPSRTIGRKKTFATPTRIRDGKFSTNSPRCQARGFGIYGKPVRSHGCKQLQHVGGKNAQWVAIRSRI